MDNNLKRAQTRIIFKKVSPGGRQELVNVRDMSLVLAGIFHDARARRRFMDNMRAHPGGHTLMLDNDEYTAAEVVA